MPILDKPPQVIVITFGMMPHSVQLCGMLGIIQGKQELQTHTPNTISELVEQPQMNRLEFLEVILREETDQEQSTIELQQQVLLVAIPILITEMLGWVQILRILN